MKRGGDEVFEPVEFPYILLTYSIHLSKEAATITDCSSDR